MAVCLPAIFARDLAVDDNHIDGSKPVGTLSKGPGRQAEPIP